ncbi:MAG: hypothetical protein K2Q33_07225, partial [Gammaproteobacteria bacterium]|nr:hypothetical protein [Gammaproteobacteria bacterium]
MAPTSKKPAGKAKKKTAVKAKKATRVVKKASPKAKPAARKAAPASLNKVYKDAPTKTEILGTLAEFADVSKNQVTAGFTGLADII